MSHESLVSMTSQGVMTRRFGRRTVLPNMVIIMNFKTEKLIANEKNMSQEQNRHFWSNKFMYEM